MDPLWNFHPSGPAACESNSGRSSSSVLKMMIDIFSSKAALKKIYTTDQKVILDVILSVMHELSPGQSSFEGSVVKLAPYFLASGREASGTSLFHRFRYACFLQLLLKTKKNYE